MRLFVNFGYFRIFRSYVNVLSPEQIQTCPILKRRKAVKHVTVPSYATPKHFEKDQNFTKCSCFVFYILAVQRRGSTCDSSAFGSRVSVSTSAKGGSFKWPFSLPPAHNPRCHVSICSKDQFSCAGGEEAEATLEN